VGILKEKLIKEQEAGECPECGTQCEANDDMESYCPECDISYEKHCSGCGSPTNNELGVCSSCVEHRMGED
jgi:hypothetical protein